jgi:3-keto-5-aminohexanoate cleavage enzyme
MSIDFRGFAQDRVIVMSAPNGARRNHDDHAALPMTAEESAQDAIALRDAGVSILHLHVRDDAGKHTLDAARYREAIAAVRDSVGDELVIQVTTEAVGQYTAAQQMAVVRELMPEAVSIAMREICPVGCDEKAAAEFFHWMKAQGIWPQYILYSVEDVLRFEDMRRRGLFNDAAPFVMFVLGEYANAVDGCTADLDALLDATDASQYPWAVCCFGRHEHEVMLAAAARGGHVRLGFENNLLLADGQSAPDNAALIREFTAKCDSGMRTAATASEVRTAFLQDCGKTL